MKQLKFLAITIIGITSFLSCSSDDEGADYNPDDYVEIPFSEAFLDGEKWYYSDVLDQNGKSVINDVLMQCDLDDTFNFVGRYKTYEINANKVNCENDPDNDILNSGTYSIIENNKNVTINLDNGTSVTRMLFVKMYKTDNGSGGRTKMTYGITTDNYTYELRRGTY